MIIFLYGPDSYRLKQGRVDIIEEYKKKYSGGVNLFYFDLSEDDNQDKLTEVLRNTSIFDEHKLAVVSGAFIKKNRTDELISILKEGNLKSIPETTFLFAEVGSEKELSLKNRDLFKILSGSNIVRIFELLNEPKFNEWARKEIEARNCSISHEALRKLTSIYSGDSWAIINEIEKLAAYKNGGEIKTGDIDLLISTEADMNIFNLIDAVGSKNHRRAIELIYQELKTGRDPYYVLTMIIYQFRNLITVQDLIMRGTSQSEITKKTALHPFVVNKAISCLDNFKTSDLKLKFKTLLDIDTRTKQGALNLVDSLYSLVLH